MAGPVELRRLARAEFSRVAEIDRSEPIDLLYEQRGTELEPEDVHLRKEL